MPGAGRRLGAMVLLGLALGGGYILFGGRATPRAIDADGVSLPPGLWQAPDRHYMALSVGAPRMPPEFSRSYLSLPSAP